MGLLLCVLLCFLGRLDRLGRRSLLTADRPAVNLELRAVARRLDDQNVVLDVDNAADKTTDGGHWRLQFMGHIGNKAAAGAFHTGHRGRHVVKGHCQLP